MTVLIVERDISLLETMRDVCHDEGIEAILLADCGEAMSFLRTGRAPDIIVCDEFAPQNHGVVFRNELRSVTRLKDIPFVLMRGQKQENVSPHDLCKPFSLEDFLSHLRKVRLSSQTRT